MNLINKLLVIAILFLGAGCKDSISSNQTPETIKIGAVFSLSGPGIKGGTAEMRAVQMAVEDINEKGGIAGKSLAVIFEDNHSDSKTTATVFKKLIGIEKVPAIIGPNWAEFTEVSAPIAEKNKVVMITASGKLPDSSETRDFVFSLQPTHEAATRPLAEYIKNKKYRRIALVKSVNAYYEGIAESLSKQIAMNPDMQVNEYTFNPGEFDYRSIISKFKKEKIEAIVVFMLEGGEQVSFFKQLKELSYNGDLFSGDLVYDPVISADPKIAEGTVFIHYELNMDSDFLEKYRNKYSEDPEFTSPKAYDVVFLLKKSVEDCGISSEQIAQCLRNISLKGISGNIDFDDYGNLLDKDPPTVLYEVLDDKFVPLH